MAKYHKIRGVPLEVCTGEQMIAYNFAFACYDWILKRENLAAEVGAMVDRGAAADKKLNRYNLGAVKNLLIAGLKEYAAHPFIAGDYERIGKAFPIVGGGAE